VRFTGTGGAYIPLGVSVASPRPSQGDVLLFTTTVDGVVPNPGTPTAPTVTDLAIAGALTGTFEYAVTFLTNEGETELGDISIPVILVASRAGLSAIPTGGPGTISRNVYRRQDGGVWGLLTTIADNATTVYTPDNAAAPGVQQPPTVSTAERVTIPVEAFEVGTQYNVAIGTITDISDAQGADLTDVTNLVTFANGSDPEGIETFRDQVLKRLRSPQSGSGDDLVSWATEIDGIESATTFPNVDLAGASAPGTVVVRVAGPAGAIPDAGKIAEVLAVLVAHDLAMITLIVAAFTPLAVASDVTLTLDTGYTLDNVTPSVEQAITDYINSVPVGGTVYRAGIYHAVFSLPGVVTLVVNTPATDVTALATEKPVPGAITVA
jgi:uncharacterized phage protein gp47/JayE